MKNATKKAISESLKRLLLKKPVNKITINDIAEDCGISRMTFYYHFQDIYDLVEWTFEEEARKVLAGNRTYDTWEQGFLNLLEALQENKAFILNVYRSVDREQTEAYMLRMVQDLLLPVVEEQSEGLRISPAGKRRVAVFYTYAFLGIVLEWLHNGMKASPAEVAEITSTILQGDFRNSLENMAAMERRQGAAAKA